MLDNIYMTHHAIDRFYQRFNKLVTEKKIHRNEINMKFQHKSRIWTDLFLPALENSTENRSFINDTGRMFDFYERYGYDTRFKFLDNLELRSRFVLCEANDGKWMIVTVMAVSHEKVKHNKKFNNPRNKLGSKIKESSSCSEEYYVEDIKRNGDLTDLFKELDNKKLAEIEQISDEDAKKIADFNKKYPHLIGIKSPYKKFKKKLLIWESDGIKRDENGYLIEESVQINKHMKLLGREPFKFRHMFGMVKVVFNENPSAFERIDSDNAIVEQEFFGHIFVFKVYGFNSAIGVKVLKIYEAEEVIE